MSVRVGWTFFADGTGVLLPADRPIRLDETTAHPAQRSHRPDCAYLRGGKLCDCLVRDEPKEKP